MPKKPELIEFPLSGGIDTNTDEKLVQLPSFLDLQNTLFSKDGSQVKRTGYTVLGDNDSTETQLSGLTNLAARGTELLAFGNNKLYNYSSTLDKWRNRGNLHLYSVSTQVVSDLPSTQTEPVFATDGVIQVTAWIDSRGGAYATVLDSGGQVLTSPFSLDANASRLTAVSTDAGVLIFYVDSTTQSINSYFFNSSTLSGLKREYLLSTLHTDYIYSAVYNRGSTADTAVEDLDPSDPHIALVWKDTSNGLTCLPLTMQGEIHSTSVINSWLPSSFSLTNVSNWISSAWDGDNWVYHAFSTTDKTILVYTDRTGDFGNSYRTVDSSNASTSGVIYIRSSDADTYVYYKVGDNIYKAAGSNYGNATTNELVHSGFSLVAQPQGIADLDGTVDEERDYVYFLGYSSTLQSCILVCNSSDEIIAQVSPGLVNLTRTGGIPAATLDSGVIKLAIAVNKRVEVAATQVDGFTQAGISALSIDLNPEHSDHVELRDSLYIGGSSIWQYDGSAVVESGFWFYPEIDKTTVAQNTQTFNTDVDNEPYSVDGNVGTLDLVYYVVYEWTDAQGKLIQSAAIPLTVLDAIDPVTQTLNFTIPKIPATRKGDVRAAVYRTHADSTAIAYRVHGYPGFDASADISFADSKAEADLKTGEILYLSSGELDNVAPRQGLILTQHNDRIFYVPTEAPLQVWYSKQPGEFEQPGFNEGLFFHVPPDGGNITGLATLDGKLVIFKRDRVYMVTGDGANNLGFNDSLSLPRLISTDTGCKNRRSIVRVPQGVMFQSDKGIYWLNRGEAVNDVGSPVDAYAQEPIKAATLVPDDQIVIFLTQGDRTLVFDYSLGAWTTWTQHAGLDAVILNDTYYYLRSNGYSVYKSSSGYLDVAAPIVVSFKTPWLRPEGVQQRWHIWKVFLLGNYLSSHTLNVTVTFNFDSAYLSYTTTWSPDNALNTSTLGGEATLGAGDLLGIGDSTMPDTVYQFKHLLKHQRIQAVQFTITEVPPASSPGASFELTSLALEAAGYGDGFKLPGSKAV